MKHDFDVQKRIFGVIYYRLFFWGGGEGGLYEKVEICTY